MRRQKQAVFRDFRVELSGPALEEAWQKERIAHHETGLAREAAKSKVSRGGEKKDDSHSFISVESLSRMSIIEVSSLTGMLGFECWREFYKILNINGNADNLLYYGDAEAAGGTARSVQRRRRKHKLEAERSLLFTLFTLRWRPSSSPVGTRCFTTLLHDARAQEPHAESHKDTGEYLKAVVFGGLDGILTSFAIVAGSAGGGLSVSVILVLGFSNIFADALSMGVGEYLSSKAHNEYVMAEKKREEWELRNHREGEILEMVEIFEKRGMSREDAEDVIRTMAKYDEFFVNIMMNEELGLQVPTGEMADTIKEGFIMFLSFAFFGAMPLLGYVVVPWIAPSSSPDVLFSVACVVTAITLFTMGAVKSQFGTRSWFMSGAEMLILGGVCAAVAYEIGLHVDSILPDTSRR